MEHLGSNILYSALLKMLKFSTKPIPHLHTGAREAWRKVLLNTTRRLVSALPYHFTYCLASSFKQKSTKRPMTSLSSNSIFLGPKAKAIGKIGKNKLKVLLTRMSTCLIVCYYWLTIQNIQVQSHTANTWKQRANGFDHTPQEGINNETRKCNEVQYISSFHILEAEWSTCSWVMKLMDESMNVIKTNQQSPDTGHGQGSYQIQKDNFHPENSRKWI